MIDDDDRVKTGNDVTRQSVTKPKPEREQAPSRRRPAADQPAATHTDNPMTTLQRTVGNQAVQRMLENGTIQRNPTTPGALPPNLMPNAGQMWAMMQAQDKPINDWLDKHRLDVMLTPQADRIAARIKKEVSQAAGRSDSDLYNLIQSWGKRNHIPVVVPAVTAPRKINANEVASAASSGLSIKGTTKIGENKGSIEVSLSGATAQLQNEVGTESASVAVTPGGVTVGGKGGGTSVKAGVSFGGDLSFNVDHGDYHFKASVTKSEWKLSLTIGSTSMPNLAGVTDAFKNGEAALRNAVKGIAASKKAEEIKTAVTDNLSAVKTAISTASAIKSASAGQFRAKIQLGGAMPGVSGKDAPAGFSAMLTLEFIF